MAKDSPDVQNDPTIEEQFMTVLKDIDSRLKGIDARLDSMVEKQEELVVAMEEVREAAAYIAWENMDDEDDQSFV